MRRATLAALTLLALLALPLLAGAEDAQTKRLPTDFMNATVDSVIGQVIKAYGGTRAISEMRGVFAEGRVYDEAEEMYLPYTHYLVSGGRFRMDIIAGGRDEYYLLNYSVAVSGVAGLSRHELGGVQRDELVYEHASLTLPRILAFDSYRAKYLGTSSVGGRVAYVLGLTLEDAPSMLVYIEARTGLILKTSARLRDTEWEVEVERHFDKYREFGGTKLPMRIVRVRDGVALERVQIMSYETNPAFSSTIFK